MLWKAELKRINKQMNGEEGERICRLIEAGEKREKKERGPSPPSVYASRDYVRAEGPTASEDRRFCSCSWDGLHWASCISARSSSGSEGYMCKFVVSVDSGRG